MSNLLDVLVLACTDNANTGWRTVQCLRQLGLNVLGLKGDIHPFLYPEQMVCHPAIGKGLEGFDGRGVVAEELRPLAEQARVLHIVGSSDVDIGLEKGTVVVQHGGSIYRENAEYFNDYWNPVAHKTVMQCPDLMGRGAKNEVWIPYAIDTNFIRPVYNNIGMLKIGHFPSNSEVKGAEDIYQVFDMVASQLPEEAKHCIKFYRSDSDNPVLFWQAHLQRLADMDVYVEALNPTLNGKPYGAWGNSALEAAAMGKIVITHNAYQEQYKNQFGDSPLRIANTKEELFNHLVEIIKTPLPELQEEMRRFRTWAVQKHSIEATAKRWWELVYKDLFPECKEVMKSIMKHPGKKRVICSVLREIHDLGSEEIKTKAEEAMVMAKKMNDKLYDYRADWDKEVFG